MSPTARSPERSGRAVTAPRLPGSSARQASGSGTWRRYSPITTCRRSSSPRRPATPSRKEELAPPTRRFLALAGERALGLDTAQAEARLARALELCPADDPERPELLLRWADAAFQAGRPREAAAALDETLDLFRARGETEGEARALILLARVAPYWARADWSRWPPRLSSYSSRSRPARHSSPPTPISPRGTSSRASTGEAIAAADRACALAQQLGLPEPAQAVGARGNARAYLGDPDGLAEMERALPMLIEQGEGNQAATLQNNLAIARYPLQGPARSLADFEQGIAFCEKRGLTNLAETLEADCPGLLVELGRPEEALERAGTLVAAVEASGGTWVLMWVHALELATHLARGEAEGASRIADWLVEAARTHGSADGTVEVLAAAAAARLATAEPEKARALLAEIEQTPGARETPYYARQLSAMLRTALAAGDPDLAARLAGGLERRYPLREHALCAARAQLAEHAGDHAQAASLYAEAAARWQAVRERPRTRPRPARPGTLPLRPRRPGRRATAPGGGEAVQLDALPPRPG